MKTIAAGLLADYALQTTTIATCLKVTRSDAVVVGFTSLDQALTVSGVTYHPGFEPSSLSSTDTLGVDNMELTFLALDDQLPEADLLSGLWNNAAFEIFECNYLSPTDGVNVLKRGTTGEVRIARGKYVVEFRSLAQAFQQTQGIVTNKTCRARLGDSKCTLDLTPFTFTSTFTAVASAQVMTDSARSEASDYFAEGILSVTSGPAAGHSQKVKTFAAGVFTLSLPLPFTPAVGNAYTVIAGCRKRLTEDCKTKFNNVVNFQGEPHLPGQDKLTKPGAAVTQPDSTPPDPYEGGGGDP